MNTRTPQRNKWFALIEEQEKSQLSVQAFCKEKGINYANMNYYRQQFKKQKISSINNKLSQQIIPVQLKPTTEKNITSLNEIKLILKNGLQCILSNMDMTAVSELLKALQSC